VKISFENNLRVKQHNFRRSCPLLYSTKIPFGDRVGADWGTTPWPSLRTSPGWDGNWAYVARGYLPQSLSC